MCAAVGRSDKNKKKETERSNDGGGGGGGATRSHHDIGSIAMAMSLVECNVEGVHLC